ncbi:MAG: hypothetical protein ACTHNY_09635 [Solirubrobacterales bacterium]
MKADYDSKANAMLIQLLTPGLCDGAVEIDETYCHVETRKGRVANIELLNPADHLHLLERTAERLGLDYQALLATAEAALAAPDREVTVEVARSAASVAAA